MENVYDKDGIQVDYCCGYEYIEIFGLTDKEFESLIEDGHLKTFNEYMENRKELEETIKIHINNETDKGSIIEGLATLISVYADNLKGTLHQVEINRNILQCESSTINRNIDRMKEISDTLAYFCESEVKQNE